VGTRELAFHATVEHDFSQAPRGQKREKADRAAFGVGPASRRERVLARNREKNRGEGEKSRQAGKMKEANLPTRH